jgi:4-amino-4-deoxy-L-arabinose transferase-like glycosyltransferase
MGKREFDRGGTLMRFLVWTWRVVLAVVVAAFIATIFYMTHDVGTDMDPAMPALNLITVIGTALLGITWTVTRRYWHALILLVALGVFRGLFGFGERELLTDFQALWLLVSIGVVGLVFVVSLTARALINDRAAKAAKAGAAQVAAQTVGAVGPFAPPAAPVIQVTAVTEPLPVPAATKEGAAPEPTAKR